MQAIQPIGGLFRTDDDGYLVNDCSLDRVRSPWREAVLAITEAFLRSLGPHLHSLYLRGSVARGLALDGVSDIDTIALLLGEPATWDTAWSVTFREDMARRYPFQAGIDLGFFPYEAVMAPERPTLTWRERRQRRPHWGYVRFLLKTESLCLAGEDVTSSIPAYKPGAALVHYALLLDAQLRSVEQQLAVASDAEAVQRHCRWLMRIIVRAGFELVMEREQSYTHDLSPSYQAFARHYPHHAPPMRQALEWAMNPITEGTVLQAFLSSFGRWLTEEVYRVFPDDAPVEEDSNVN